MRAVIDLMVKSKEIRRIGKMTNVEKTNSFIDYACIFGVCTPEMKNLCKKLELAFDELNLTYIIKDYT